jgi:hypothetical protein
MNERKEKQRKEEEEEDTHKHRNYLFSNKNLFRKRQSTESCTTHLLLVISPNMLC